MNQQIVNKTPYRRKHAARRRVNEVENILRPGPLRQHSFDTPLFQGSRNHLFRQQRDADTAYRSLKSHTEVTGYKPRLQLDVLSLTVKIC